MLKLTILYTYCLEVLTQVFVITIPRISIFETLRPTGVRLENSSLCHNLVATHSIPIAMMSCIFYAMSQHHTGSRNRVTPAVFVEKAFFPFSLVGSIF